MKKFKKIIALLICLILALTVVGCGKEKTNNDELQNDIDEVQSQIDDTAKENSQNKVGKYVTPDESAFIFEEVTGGVAIAGYLGSDKAIIIPDTLEGKNVVEIRSGAFNSAGILGIKLPNTLSLVTEKAFLYCTTLLEVYVGDRTTAIAPHAFEGCVALSFVKLNSGLTDIGRRAFSNCKMLEGITLNSGLISIGNGAFLMSGLKTVKISSSVKIIGAQSFTSCSNLEKVIIEDGVQQIAEKAFEACVSLKNVSIPASVNDVGLRAFNQCPNVTISAPAGSTAETYAAENNITFKAS